MSVHGQIFACTLRQRGGGVIGRQRDKDSSTKVIKDRKRKTEREGIERAID